MKFKVWRFDLKRYVNAHQAEQVSIEGLEYAELVVHRDIESNKPIRTRPWVVSEKTSTCYIASAYNRDAALLRAAAELKERGRESFLHAVARANERVALSKKETLEVVR